MISLVIRSVVIAIVLAIALTAVSSVLTATYHQSSEAFGVSRALTGFEAVSAMIDAFGVVGYIKASLGVFLLFFAGIFLGALWQGLWMLRNANAP